MGSLVKMAETPWKSCEILPMSYTGRFSRLNTLLFLIELIDEKTRVKGAFFNPLPPFEKVQKIIHNLLEHLWAALLLYLPPLNLLNSLHTSLPQKREGVSAIRTQINEVE